MASESVMITLTVDTLSNRVIFAEAGVDFVDILLSFLTLPLGTIVRLTGSKTAHCLNNIYKSVDNLKDAYFKLNSAGKEMLLQPCYEAQMACLDLAVNLEGARALSYYACRSCCLLSPYKTKCDCGNTMYPGFKVERQICKSNVFLKGVARFIITDDFVIIPASTQAAMTLIGGLPMQQLSNLEEKAMTIRRDEVLMLLQRSLVSDNAFTDTYAAKVAKTTVCTKRSQKKLEKPISRPLHDPKHPPSVRIKLIIDNHENKVLYAESDKHFADLLFSFLTYPSGSVVINLNKNSHVTCLDNLYASVRDLDISGAFVNIGSKYYIMSPKLPPFFLLRNSFIKFQETETPRLYVCPIQDCNSRRLNLVPSETCCYHSSKKTDKLMKMFDPKCTDSYYGRSIEGFVNDATYMVTDDLVITPLRSVLSVTRLIANTKGGIKELFVDIGQKEMLLLLQAALISETALTDVFVNYKEASETA